MSKEFARPLRLVTPHMHGPPVTDAQYLMAGHNRFEGLATLKDANVDGDYGEVSAGGTKRAKYWVGYPLAACDGVFGQTLYEYLRKKNWRPLPDAYRDRRQARLNAAQVTPGLKAFRLAIAELGYKETPRNWTKFGREYGFDGVPWCAIFESIMFKHAGFPWYRYAAVENIYRDAVSGRNHLRIVYSPQQGDICCFSLHGTRFAHTAFFDRWTNKPRGLFRDLGGNTGPSSISNGGMVAYGDRNTSQVLAFVRAG